jgi:predicted RNA-binding protein with PUA-like domain
MKMNYYLAKTEPSVYSIDQLEKDGKTVWDGVTNPQAVRAILEMKPGDRVLIYHSGGQSAIVGIATVVKEGRPDPKNSKSAVADLEFFAKIETPVTLADVKKSGLFDDWALVRQGRLSTMPVPGEFVRWLKKRVPSPSL